MRKTTRYFSVNLSDLDGTRLVGFLDMLRYDRAQVELTTSDVVVMSNDRGPTVDRWNSFGIPVLVTWGDDAYSTLRESTQSPAYRPRP